MHSLDLVMSMCNLIEHSSNYFETTTTLLFYSEDEATNSNTDIENNNNFKSFEYTTIAVSLKYLNNF